MQNETEDVLDFGDGVLVVLIASSSEKLLRQLLRPVCLVQGYDLVLPDASCHHLLRGWEWRLLRRPGVRVRAQRARCIEVEHRRSVACMPHHMWGSM